MRKMDKNATTETVLVSLTGIEDSADIQTGSTLRFPGLEIRILEHVVYRNNDLISLTRREFLTLTYLAKHPNWVFSSDSIYEAVWKEYCGNRGTAVSNVISQIRRKLTPDTPRGGYIVTVIGSGYKFVIPE